MDIIKKHLNYIGLVLILAALIALRIWPHLKTVPVIFLILGAAAIGLYMYLNLSLLKQGFKRKSFLYSSNLLLLVVFVLGILVLVNVFLARHHHRFDFTETRIHSLSDQTVTVLENLEEDISVHLFFREGNMTRGRMENLMQNYRYHSNRIKYEFIDPDKNPGLVKRYDVKQDGTTIFESGEKDNRITDVSEEEITNALIKISRGEKKTVYFLEGHGEGGIEDTEDLGYSLAKDELEKMGYEVKTLSLALSETFPGDIALLIVPGPEKDLLPNELDTIRGYISGGGRVFLMIDPETAPGMTEFVKEYGIGLSNDLVIDTVSRLLGGD
ncbi:MAG: GldG family protein, partial [Acidobacteria bacterium]|nr:GldG family protein [Acidobacteriota bacterium]